MIGTLILAVFLLAANGFFVAAEFALVKVRGHRIDTLAGEGGARAQLTGRILANLEAYLAACQLGITMTSLGLGWIGEPAVAAMLQPLFHAMGMSEAMLHTVSFIIGFLIFSSLHIVIGEQVPKTFAIRLPETVSLWTAYPLHAFFLLCFPLNWGLNRASRAILRAIGVAEAGPGEHFSEDELRGIISASRAQGLMRKVEHDMLGGILDLEEVAVQEIMTHRKNMVGIGAEQPIEEVIRHVRASPYTRFPVWNEDPDKIVGILHAKDLLNAVEDRREGLIEEVDVMLLAADAWFIPETTSLRHQLFAFRQRHAHMAIVVDEYGAVLGLVTLEDIVEEIVGEIVDELDIETSGVQRSADGTIIARGEVTVRDLNRQFDWSLPDEEASTIAGLVINEAERIPDVGERFAFEDFSFEILERERNRIVSVRIRRAGG
jgi:CBS domain containing-hemolysin-like protein